MLTRETQIKGGRATAIKSRQAALDKYYQDPNYCLACNNIINVKPNVAIQAARRQKFCCRSCAASYNNQRFIKRKKSFRICLACNAPANSQSGLCLKCRNLQMSEKAGQKTKSEIFTKRSGYQSARSHIRRHAALSYVRSEKPVCCFICGYDTYIEVCHIHPVRDFPGEATLAKINHPDNLVALCPNHHWELDHGILKLE